MSRIQNALRSLDWGSRTKFGPSGRVRTNGYRCCGTCRRRVVGISPGQGNQFAGTVAFVRIRGSKISIGDGEWVLSAASSNRHDLNCTCMLTTLCPDAEIWIAAGSAASVTPMLELREQNDLLGWQGARIDG